MTKNFRHIAVIPARAGSIGLPQKNQIFFDNTANFIDKISWFDEIVVNSNDSIVLDKARSKGLISINNNKVEKTQKGIDFMNDLVELFLI